MHPPNRSLRVLAFAALCGVAGSGAQSCSESSPKTMALVPGESAIDPASGARPAAGVRDGDGAANPAGDPAGPPPGTQLDASACDNGCPDGYLCCAPCCLAGLAPVCQKAALGKCPLPDLTVSEAALATKLSVDTLEAGECEIQEKCLDGPGTRKVLRFDVSVPNKGPVDSVLGNPDAGGPFEYAPCHKHFHFQNFAQYTLLDDAGTTVIHGRKQAFCARDSARADQGADFVPKYDCVNQGIQKGWADVYDPSLPCQYLDITDLPSGTYWLEVEVNPNKAITEVDYENNHARVRVDVP